MKKYKIDVAGTVYVGLSIASSLLSQHHQVMTVGILPEKAAFIKWRLLLFKTNNIEKQKKASEFDSHIRWEKTYSDADFILTSIPSNYMIR